MLYIISDDFKQWKQQFEDLTSKKIISELIDEISFSILFKIYFYSFNICIDFNDWPSDPQDLAKKQQQLNDEFQENTMLLALYNLIGLCEHDNDYHNYKQIVSIHSTKNE